MNWQPGVVDPTARGICPELLRRTLPAIALMSGQGWELVGGRPHDLTTRSGSQKHFESPLSDQLVKVPAIIRRNWREQCNSY
jgi:hypothetical protein